MDKIKTLSAAIRYGSTFIGETRLYVEQRHSTHYNCGCALGTAYLAVIEPDLHRLIWGQELMRALNARFGVPSEVLARVSFMHYEGQLTRAQCADWLEARGY